MQPSIFNLRVPLESRSDVFLMNTMTDAQLIVSSDVAALLDRFERDPQAPVASEDEREAVSLLEENGFLVPDRRAERQSIDQFFEVTKSSNAELHITVLTTLQCNFACDYCYQGDRGDYNKFAEKMTIETAQRTADWIERELDRVRPDRLHIMFFGGEPLLNLPAMYLIAERMKAATAARALKQTITIVTNGLLLSEEIVDTMLPWGLYGVKITLDGDRDTHNRMRPLRGGQGTFDRIVDNIRTVAHKTRVAIGGNYDESSVDSYPALLDYLREQDFADRLSKVNFKPVVREKVAAAPKGVLPLIPVNADGKPLGGTCMTSAGAGTGNACDSCGFAESSMSFLREETKKHGFPTPDGVHGGPCHVHMKHAHTIGTDGSLYPCAGFTGDKGQSVGHIDDRRDPVRMATRAKFDQLNPWSECGDCAYIPVCAGGCLVASHSELGDMNRPTCHKRAFESATVALAHEVARAN
ncbi:MAG: radical SAM protein [Vicinamibacterales bacterium]